MIINKTVRTKRVENPIKLKVKNRFVETPFEVACEFNTYFSSVATSDITSHTPFKHPGNNASPPVSSMALAPVDEVEVARVIDSLKPKKSCDINGMSVWLLNVAQSTW